MQRRWCLTTCIPKRKPHKNEAKIREKIIHSCTYNGYYRLERPFVNTANGTEKVWSFWSVALSWQVGPFIFDQVVIHRAAVWYCSNWIFPHEHQDSSGFQINYQRDIRRLLLNDRSVSVILLVLKCSVIINKGAANF